MVNNKMLKVSNIFSWWSSKSLLLRIFIGIVIGTLLGLFAPGLTGIAILGKVFISGLKGIAPILVAVLVAASIARAKGGLGPRFRTVILLYMLSTLLAAFVAVVGSTLYPVGMTLKDAATDNAPTHLADIFSNMLVGMMSNPMLSISNANYIGILLWAVLAGLALKRFARPATIDVVNDLANVVSAIVGWVIQLAPFGILGLVFESVSEGGLNIFADYGQLILLLVGCMLFSALVVNPLISFLFTRRNPYPLLWMCLRESGLNAFFTRSSAANIPINMNLCRKLGLDEDFYSVSIPLGATINMNGAAVTITIMTLAVAHTVGVEVNFLSALILCAIAALGACGTSGVAGGSLLLIPLGCSFFGISPDVSMQAVAVGFIIGVIQDSVETALNSSGDVFFTATAEKNLSPASPKGRSYSHPAEYYK